MSNKTTYLLTGDIGGTNSRMALYDTSCSIPLCNVDYENEVELAEGAQDGIFERKIVVPFLEKCWKTVHGIESLERSEIVACLACAGPVNDNTSLLSNRRNVAVNGTAIVNQIYVKNKFLEQIQVCRIINDFVAQGYGCLTLEPDEVKELMPDSHIKIDPRGPKVCVGAGTGLGQCFLTVGPDGHYECYASEGGHVEFSPRNDLQISLLKHLMKKFEAKHRVSVERVVSGTGLANVYEFLSVQYPDKVDAKVHEEFLNAGAKQGKVVGENATKEGSLCHEAMRITISAYGSEAGSTAIKFIPTGGLFLTGGLTPKNMHFIEGPDSDFMTAYMDKGRVKSLLQKVPLFAVMGEDLGVRGVHKAAVMEYEKLHGFDTSKKTTSATNSWLVPCMLTAATAIAAMSIGVLVGKNKKA